MFRGFYDDHDDAISLCHRTNHPAAMQLAFISSQRTPAASRAHCPWNPFHWLKVWPNIPHLRGRYWTGCAAIIIYLASRKNGRMILP
jgi:hypothetical protein